MTYTISFKQAREHNACPNKYAILRQALPEYGDDDPIPITEILRITEIGEALWSLGYCGQEGAIDVLRRFALACARHGEHNADADNYAAYACSTTSASAAANAATYVATYAATYAFERQWQKEKLKEMLEEKIDNTL